MKESNLARKLKPRPGNQTKIKAAVMTNARTEMHMSSKERDGAIRIRTGIGSGHKAKPYSFWSFVALCDRA